MHKTKRGFTLVEILIYTGILGVTASILTGVLLNATKIKSKQTATIEVNNQLNFALQNIQRSIEDSSNIDIQNGVSTSTLTLKFKNELQNPTTFYVSDGILYKKEGASTAQPVTDSKVVVDAVNFLKVSGYSGHDSVQIDLTLRYNSQNPDASFSKTLSSAIARVSAATFDSNLIPGADNFYDVGQSSARWNNMYLSGKLGIGTTNPGVPLEAVQTGTGYSAFFRNSNSTGQSGIVNWNDLGNWAKITKSGSALNGTVFGINEAGSFDLFTNIGNVNLGTGDASNITFGTNSLARMTINGSGNVGIGTSDPRALLQISTSTAITTLNSNPTVNQLAVLSGADPGTTALNYGVSLVMRPITNRGAVASIAAVNDGSNKEGYAELIFSTGGGVYPSTMVERMRINTNGNVGIGTVAPGAKLEIAGNGIVGTDSANTTLQIGKPNGSATYTNSIVIYGLDRNAQVKYNGSSLELSSSYGPIYLNPATNVGIGTANPSQKLDVAGSINVSNGIYGSGIGVVTYQDVSVNTAATWALGSLTGYAITTSGWTSSDLTRFTRVLAVDNNAECGSNSIGVGGRFFMVRNGGSSVGYIFDTLNWSGVCFNAGTTFRVWYINN